MGQGPERRRAQAHWLAALCLTQGLTDITALMVGKPGGPRKLLQGHKINTGETNGNHSV